MSVLGLIVGAIFAWLIASFARTAATDRRGDPVYKKNLDRLIERNRQFEEAREVRNAARSRHD
jgi:hypothetical protein